MNCVDWTGGDTAPLRRAPTLDSPLYPTFAQQQARYATPAYAMFRMLARNVAYGSFRCGPHPVLAIGMLNPTSAGPQDLHSQVRVLAVRQPDRIIVTLLNPASKPALRCEVDWSLLDAGYRHVVVRELGKCRDKVVADTTVDKPSFRLDLASLSLTQVFVTSESPVGSATALRLEERSATPGGLAGLALHQTTRLRAIAVDGAVERDLTDVNVVWSSSNPEVVRADQCGLIQRMADSVEAVTIAARTLDGELNAEVVIGGSFVNGPIQA